MTGLRQSYNQIARNNLVAVNHRDILITSSSMVPSSTSIFEAKVARILTCIVVPGHMFKSNN